MSRFTVGVEALRGLPLWEVAPLLGIPLCFITLFVIFIVQNVLFGLVRSERIGKFPRQKLVPRFFLEYAHWMLTGLGRVVVALGISADAVTVASLVVGVASAIACGAGRFILGGWLLYLAFACDGLDGVVARLHGTSSDRGEFFDSFIDRYADFAAYLGFMWYYKNDLIPLSLAVSAMVGSTVMGYARAKGEAVGIDPNVGWAQRHERAFILGSCTVLAPIAAAFIEPRAAHPRYHLVLVALALIAIFTNVTAVWRAEYVMSRMAARKANRSVG